jgi:DNA recombination protein RmuC
MDVLTLVAIFVALAAGLGIGWFVWGAAAARVRAAELKVAQLQERADRADLLQATLNQVTLERDESLRTLEGERGRAVERERAFAAQLQQLTEAKEALSAQFSEVGGKLLAEAQRQFLERAEQRFGQQQEKSEGQLKALLQPVSETLKRHEEQVGRIEKERTEAYGNLTGLIQSMREGQDQVRSEAAKLVNALRAAPKARGRWGELQLRNILEQCGLSEHADFQTEVSVESAEGRLRPDVVIRVPGGQSLVIDAKLSFNDYQSAFEAVDDAQKAIHLLAHAASVKKHINALSGKAYWSQFDDAPDYVIMFIPGEHFLSAALEHDPDLWQFAFERRVLLATPTNLIAIARTVAAVWRQEKLARDAAEIGLLGKEMYDRLAVAAGLLKTVGSGLSTAVNNYNKFVSSFESRVLVTGRRFRDLNIEAGAKEIEDVPPVEALPRHADIPQIAPPDAEAAE